MIPTELIISRARARCAQHRGPTSGFCHGCFRAELEEYLARENPTMKRDDVCQLVDECLAEDGMEN
jgi:hypothetical protein